ALERNDADPGAQIRHVLVNRQLGRQLTDEEQAAIPAVAAEATGPMEVVELREVVPVAVEDLHAVVLAIGHLDEPVGWGGDVGGKIETPGVGPRLAPREEVAARRVVFVHA